MGVKYSQVYGNSKLIINQVKGKCEVRNKDLVLYHRVTIVWAKKFRRFYINHVLRKNNTRANALASLADALALSPKVEQKVLVSSQNLYHPKQALEVIKDAK